MARESCFLCFPIAPKLGRHLEGFLGKIRSSACLRVMGHMLEKPRPLMEFCMAHRALGAKKDQLEFRVIGMLPMPMTSHGNFRSKGLAAFWAAMMK